MLLQRARKFRGTTWALRLVGLRGRVTKVIACSIYTHAPSANALTERVLILL